MAKLETTLTGSIDRWGDKIREGILQGSVSASLEDESAFESADGQCQCRVLVFERYSMAGGNRLSLSVTLFQDATGNIDCSAISSGGSQAAFFKLNTWGEENFLDRFRAVIGQ
ncbi:MAG: hypothetical protein IKQ54_06625 [Oscillospiraceae bacterium]|nr:hypothetical protein [Oscillospiraceae bacterium]